MTPKKEIRHLSNVKTVHTADVPDARVCYAVNDQARLFGKRALYWAKIKEVRYAR